MTNQTKSGRSSRFVRAHLPWIVGAAALLVYLLTLNHWVSLSNLNLVARSAGWVWGPELYAPLFYVLTYPFRWLPADWIPLAYNLFSAVCGALVLALLARSVALLPHDRTENQRQRERSKSGLLSLPAAWIPPVLAVTVCGFQLNFWEGTIGGSAELLDLLLMAYIVCSLLEFRLDGDDSRLMRAALVCGAAMANNWLMFCLFPAFLVALVWIKRLEFFNRRFLFRMFLCGVTGLLLYLLMPAIHVLSDHPMVSFWRALKVNLALDKNAFLLFASRLPVNTRLMLLVPSFLPIVLIGIRWASNFGDPSRMGGALATGIFHLTHGALLAACVWIAFDPAFGPRHLHYPVLALYFFSGLSVGYLSGYFLLVFKPLSDRLGRTTPLQHALHRTSVAGVAALLLLVPAGLIYRNLPQVRMTAGPEMKHYASLLVRNLPERAVLLSDDARRLYLAEARLAEEKRAQNYLFVDTHLLTIPGYHGFLQQSHPADWPTIVDPGSTNEVMPAMLIRLVDTLERKSPVYYLHPSFGYYFELFDGRPRGLVLELKRYPTNSLAGPPASEAEQAENEKVWEETEPELETLIRFSRAPTGTNVTFDRVLADKLKIPFEPNLTARMLAGFYSQSLDSWGVRMQQAGKLAEAGHHFRLALNLNPDNLAAQSNWEANRDLRAGKHLASQMPQSLEDELGKYQSWEQVLQATGPFDDPVHCFGLAVIFAQGRLLRQSGQMFERSHALAPDNPVVQLWLAGIYTRFRLPNKALDLLAQLRAHPETTEAAGIRQLDLFPAQASALFAADRTAEGAKLLEETMHNNWQDTNVLGAVIQIAAMFRQYTNAISAVDRLLQLQPNNTPALMTKASFALQTTNYSTAIDALTRVISRETNNYNAQLYRAIAFLGGDQLDEAQRDYLALQKTFPRSTEVASGLAEIAWRRKDTNTAIHYYSLCLSNSAAINSNQVNFVKERLAALRSESP